MPCGRKAPAHPPPERRTSSHEAQTAPPLTDEGTEAWRAPDSGWGPEHSPMAPMSVRPKHQPPGLAAARPLPSPSHAMASFHAPCRASLTLTSCPVGRTGRLIKAHDRHSVSQHCRADVPAWPSGGPCLPALAPCGLWTGAESGARDVGKGARRSQGLRAEGAGRAGPGRGECEGPGTVRWTPSRHSSLPGPARLRAGPTRPSPHSLPEGQCRLAHSQTPAPRPEPPKTGPYPPLLLCLRTCPLPTHQTRPHPPPRPSHPCPCLLKRDCQPHTRPATHMGVAGSGGGGPTSLIQGGRGGAGPCWDGRAWPASAHFLGKGLPSALKTELGR